MTAIPICLPITLGVRRRGILAGLLAVLIPLGGSAVHHTQRVVVERPPITVFPPTTFQP